MKKRQLLIVILVCFFFTGCQTTFFSGDYIKPSSYQTRSYYQVAESDYLGNNLFFQGEIGELKSIKYSLTPTYYADSVSELAILIYYLYQADITKFNVISQEEFDADMIYNYMFAIMPENAYIWFYPLENPVYSSYSYMQVQVYRLDEYEKEPVYEEINKIVAELDEDLTDREKVKAVHDYIILHAEYDEAAFKDSANIDRGWDASSAYSILVDKVGMCTGYSKAFFLIMRELGIPSIVVAGDAGGAHAWNLVYLDNEWYQIDLTWDDPIPDRKGKVHYQYYLKPISSGRLAQHHYNTKYDGSLTLEQYLEYLDLLFPSKENTESN